jgi:hypothetical protein
MGRLSITHAEMEGSNNDELRGRAQFIRSLLNLKPALLRKADNQGE